MKLLVTGAAGMLGTDVCDELTRRGHVVVRAGREPAADRIALDIADAAQTLAAVQSVAPDTIIHCAAWTNVDGAERDPDGAFLVNECGSENVARAGGAVGAWMLAVSTDFVFDGAKGSPYIESDPVNPLGVYGVSKEAGERKIREMLPARHIIARTSWLFGKYGKSFPETIVRLAAKLPEVPVVSDQRGTPTHTVDLARVLADLAESPEAGTYHVSGEGECSWWEFAQAIVLAHGLDTPVVPITAQEYADRFASPTVRPAYSVLENRVLRERGFASLPHWRDALANYLAR